MVLELIPQLASFGYTGVFFLSMLSSATIFFPLPYFVAVFALASTLNPLILTTVAAVGSTIGELTGFYAGRLGHKFLEKRHEKLKWLLIAEEWFRKHRGFAILVFISASPLPTDIGGVVAGALHYDVKRFFLAILIGKMMKFAFIAYAGFYSFGFLTDYFGIA